MVYGSEGLFGHLRAPRVPFDLKCLILATAGFLTIGILNSLLASWWDVVNPVGQLVGYAISETGRFSGYFELAANRIRGIVALDPEFTWWQAVITAAVCGPRSRLWSRPWSSTSTAAVGSCPGSSSRRTRSRPAPR